MSVKAALTYILAFMTTSTKAEAKKIAQTLLEKRLIACANIYGPVESRFWWQGKIDEAKEFLVFMKSDQRLVDRLVEVVKQMHSYEVPEVLTIPIVGGYHPYLEWLRETLSVSGE